MKKEKNKHPRGASVDREQVRNWQPLFARIQDAIDWALDLAKGLARDYEEELDAVERVRGYAHAWVEGRPVDVEKNDILTVLAILFAKIEIDVGIDNSPMLEAVRRFPSVLHLPGAARDELPTVVIRRYPLRRNGGALFTRLAA